jgi:D-arginine dehydrogenase
VAAGYFLAPFGRVRVLEAEPQTAYHATGRSAALFSEYYGNAVVRRLTAASFPFYDRPPPGFADHRLLAPRGVLALCPPGAEAAFDAAVTAGRQVRGGVSVLARSDIRRLCPIVRQPAFVGALLRPSAMDIDVAAAHLGFTRGIRQHGGDIHRAARVARLDHVEGRWWAHTDSGQRFDAHIVVNAAGPWADRVAALAGAGRQGMTVRRRTAAVIPAPAGHDVRGWPVVTDIPDTFYAKPESGDLLLSPSDDTPTEPGDARPDDLDVALAAHRFEAATTVPVRRIIHCWAGLRAALPDDLPVIGADRDVEDFYWLAGLAGYGIQLAPAAGALLAALISGRSGHPIGAAVRELSATVAPRTPSVLSAYREGHHD